MIDSGIASVQIKAQMDFGLVGAGLSETLCDFIPQTSGGTGDQDTVCFFSFHDLVVRAGLMRAGRLFKHEMRILTAIAFRTSTLADRLLPCKQLFIASMEIGGKACDNSLVKQRRVKTCLPEVIIES